MSLKMTFFDPLFCTFFSKMPRYRYTNDILAFWKFFVFLRYFFCKSLYSPNKVTQKKCKNVTNFACKISKKCHKSETFWKLLLGDICELLNLKFFKKLSNFEVKKMMKK